MLLALVIHPETAASKHCFVWTVVFVSGAFCGGKVCVLIYVCVPPQCFTHCIYTRFLVEHQEMLMIWFLVVDVTCHICISTK